MTRQLHALNMPERLEPSPVIGDGTEVGVRAVLEDTTADELGTDNNLCFPLALSPSKRDRLRTHVLASLPRSGASGGRVVCSALCQEEAS